MTLYEELDAMFPSHSHFYTVGLTDMNEALEKCARMTSDNAHVFNYNGQMYLSVQHSLGNDIPWLTEVPGYTEDAPE